MSKKIPNFRKFWQDRQGFKRAGKGRSTPKGMGLREGRGGVNF